MGCGGPTVRLRPWGRPLLPPPSRGDPGADRLAATATRAGTGPGAGARKAREDGRAAPSRVEVGWGLWGGGGREGAGWGAALGNWGSVGMGGGECVRQERDLGVDGGPVPGDG